MTRLGVKTLEILLYCTYSGVEKFSKSPWMAEQAHIAVVRFHSEGQVKVDWLSRPSWISMSLQPYASSLLLNILGLHHDRLADTRFCSACTVPGIPEKSARGFQLPFLRDIAGSIYLR